MHQRMRKLDRAGVRLLHQEPGGDRCVQGGQRVCEFGEAGSLVQRAAAAEHTGRDHQRLNVGAA
jgi:hypothetical protein